MRERYEQLLKEAAGLAAELADPKNQADHQKLGEIKKRHSALTQLTDRYAECFKREEELAEYREVIASEPDGELAQMAKRELPEAESAQATLQAEIEELERPKDPLDEKPAIMEIRAGAGGDEASLFAKELYGAYTRYAEKQGWKIELLSTSASEAGGYKELIAAIRGEGAFGRLRFEAGTHRVQRIPVTESGGRIHTSTVTVAVLPEAEETEVEIKPEEIRVDVFRSSGPGGQSVNTTDSAVRITHQPTGITVSVQDEKSQHKNKAKALSILRTRLRAKEEAEAAAERGDARRQQIGSGDRSEKVRTYNIPQDRVTDHRINLTRHGVAKVLAGELDPIIDALAEAARAQR